VDPIGRLAWNDDNLEHIARHGMTRWEVEELRHNQPLVIRVGRIRYRSIGVTDDGRYLTVFLDLQIRGVYYVVTARDSVEASVGAIAPSVDAE
jgi:hypothetical protein